MPLVLQLSDTHLLQDPEERLRGVPTRTTLSRVLELALQHHPTVDRVVLTGDIAHDERAQTYVALRQLLGDATVRVVPGNHDDRAGLRAAFPDQVDDELPAIRFVDDVGDWRLLGVDTQITGQNDGRLGEAQRQWLRDTLAAAPDRPTVVFMHHPPILTGHPFLDEMGLRDAEAFGEILAGAPQVRGVFCGHIHRAMTGCLGAIDVHAAPSTAFQFPAHSDLGAYELLPPGCRLLHLGDELRTEVLRLPELEHVPVERRH